MSQVSTYIWRATAGDKTSASSANNIYGGIQTASTSINEDNTRTEAISRRHLYDLSESPVGTAHPTFSFCSSKNNPSASQAFNNTVYADIAYGGGTTIALGPITLKAGEAIRLQGSFNMIECTKGIDGGGANALDTDVYYYAFFGTVNGVLTQLSPSYGYSLLANSGSLNGNYQVDNQSFSDKIQGKLIVNQREGFSYIYFNKTNIDQTIADVRVRFRVQTPLGGATANSVKLKEFSFVAIGVR